MLGTAKSETLFFSPGDPEPVETVNHDGRSAFMLTCEHAGRAIPKRLGDLGVAAPDMDRHIAWDVGAEGLSRRLAQSLDAPLFLQRYSRLVVDCNRPFEAPDCFVAASDATPVPGNAGLTGLDRRQRFEAIHQPFHDAVARHLDRRAAERKPAILIAIHSFTPRLAGGAARPWHLGVLANRYPRFAKALLAAFDRANPAIPSAYNEPYTIDDLSDYTIPVHGERRGLPHALLEIRNDLIGDGQGQQFWAELLAAALRKTLSVLAGDIAFAR
jgi:predicted N-formylglutamate amidohydrolase